MFKLFAIVFAAILAIAAAAPGAILSTYSAPVVSTYYGVVSPQVGPLAYSAPVASYATAGFAAPVAYY